MAEGVQAALRFQISCSVAAKTTPEVPSVTETTPSSTMPTAHGLRGLVAPAADHRGACPQARRLGGLGAEIGVLGTGDSLQAGSQAARNVQRRQHLGGPAPVLHVEQGHARASETSVAYSPVSR